MDKKKEEPADEAAYWLKELKASGKRDEAWIERADKVLERYRDEQTDSQYRQKRMNLLWSNVETKGPLLYARTPKPVIDRRFKDKNPTAMVAGKILERAVTFCIDSYDFDGIARDLVQDYLLPGRAIARVSYKPIYGGELTDPQTKQVKLDEQGQPLKEVVYEEAKLEYLFWKDVRFGPGKRYDEVPWIAYRSFMSREELVKEFGAVGDEVTLTHCDPDQKRDEQSESDKKGEVWEVWSKTNKQVYWVAIGFQKLLRKSPPPLNLRNFFPSPKPLQAVKTNDKLTPIPEFAQYQDQADEIDKLTARIDHLTDAVKVVGVYDATNEGLQRILSEGVDNTLIPISNFALLAEKGGLEGGISWLPIEQVVKALQTLTAQREQLKQNLYEVSGLSDIIRGASDPNETLGAQEIKRQFAGMRVDDKQKAVAEFLRDCLELKAEVIAEQFSPQTLQLMTGVQLPTTEQKAMQQQAGQPTSLPTWEDVIKLLRTDPIRTFSIDIETDSTIAVDERDEKESRMEFLQAVTGFMKQTAEIAPAAPQLLPLMGELLMFGVRGFRVGRDLEQSIEDAIQGAQQQPAQAQPDPEAQKKMVDDTVQQATQQIEERHRVEMETKDAEHARAILGKEEENASLRLKLQADQEHERLRQTAAPVMAEKAANEEIESKRTERDAELDRLLSSLVQAMGSMHADSQQQVAQLVSDAMQRVAEAVGKKRQLKVQRQTDGSLIGESE